MMFAYLSKMMNRTELRILVVSVHKDTICWTYVVPQSREPTNSPCFKLDIIGMAWKIWSGWSPL